MDLQKTKRVISYILPFIVVAVIISLAIRVMIEKADLTIIAPIAAMILIGLILMILNRSSYKWRKK